MKSNDSKKRKSNYNPNRTCYTRKRLHLPTLIFLLRVYSLYNSLIGKLFRQRVYLTADGKYYCYERWDDDAKCVVTQKLEVGKDLSVELTIMLDEFDHDMDLQDRYEGELRDPLFDAKVNSYKADPDDENAVDPWDMLADKSGSPEDALFAEPEPENPQAAQVRRVIDEDCTEAQQDFFFEHFGEGMQLEEMRQIEAGQTGKLASSAAMTNRKNKIIDKVAKSFGVERVKRHKYPKKD